MFEEKYIMTGIVTMLIVAAWQKPELYKEQLSNKIMFLSTAIIILFGVWEAALSVAHTGLPEELNDVLQKSVVESINSKSVPPNWWIFIVFLYFASFFFDWLSEISLKYEKDKQDNT